MWGGMVICETVCGRGMAVCETVCETVCGGMAVCGTVCIALK